MSSNYDDMLAADLAERAKDILKENPTLSMQQALEKARRQLIAFGPWNPPKNGCPINGLPNELLAHIFTVGKDTDDDDIEEEFLSDLESDEDGNEDDDEESDEDDVATPPPDSSSDSAPPPSSNTVVLDVDPHHVHLHSLDEDGDKSVYDDEIEFPILVSHVCKHWRQVALDTPSLWTNVVFSLGDPLPKAAAFIERSKELLLDISIDAAAPDEWEQPEKLDDDKVAQADEQLPFLSAKAIPAIMDLIVPHIHRWQSFNVQATLYNTIYAILERLSESPAAPELKALQFYHYEDCDEYDSFKPVEFKTPFVLFSGQAPKLEQVAFWGVHLDWEKSLSFLTGLKEVELAYHANDIRPSYETFSKILTESPDLDTLSLCLSGPREPSSEWGVDGELQAIEIPSLKHLILCHHEPEYIEALFPLLTVPNVIDLQLDYDTGDYSNFARMLAKPQGSSKKSLLSGLEHFKISTLSCDKSSKDAILHQLKNLKAITLNCSGEEEEFFDKLMLLHSPKPAELQVVFCPHLQTIATTAIDGKKMRKFINVRKNGGAPIKSVSMCEEDDLEQQDEDWIRKNVDDLQFFELSSEEEYTDDEEGDEEEEEEEGNDDDDNDDDEDDNNGPGVNPILLNIVVHHG